MSTTANEKFSEAVRAVGADLRSLSRKEFTRELERHRVGDITRMLLETNALCVQQRYNGEEV